MAAFIHVHYFLNEYSQRYKARLLLVLDEILSSYRYGIRLLLPYL